MFFEEKLKVRITYVNHRGDTSVRTVRPLGLVYEGNQWHKETQWLLRAWDYEKSAERHFAMKDIKGWKPLEE